MRAIVVAVIVAAAMTSVAAQGPLTGRWRLEAAASDAGLMGARGLSVPSAFVLREYGPNNAPTGRMIRWHPGGGHHGPEPYWRVNAYNSKSGIIR